MVGIRISPILKSGKFNFDCPGPDSACVKWSVSGGEFGWGAIAGVSVKGYFPCIYREDRIYKTNYFQNSTVKIVLVSTDGRLAVSNEFKLSDKFGHFNKPEGPDNFILDIGNLEFKKVDERILRDENKLLNYLGLQQLEYDVEYSDE
ncbi:MAG: hypothetical protein JW982_00520 [Spirochaetes bacterium]|nr:hypothetical protein [Spirochaetota bacterium]